jgi:nucleoid-associated protein YgaU
VTPYVTGFFLPVGGEINAEIEHAAPQALFYTVKRGRTRSRRSRRHTMAMPHYPRIFEANRPLLRDPNEIYPGQTLRIPQ